MQGAFQIEVCEVCWGAVTWSCDEKHVEIVLNDEAIEVGVDQVDAGAGAPMAK